VSGSRRARSRPADRAARLRTLARLTQLVSSSLDPETVLRAVAHAAAELMGAALVTIWTADEAARTLTCGAFSDERLGDGFPLSAVRFGEGIVGLAAARRRAVGAPDLARERRTVAAEWVRAKGLRSAYAAPIFSDGALLGVLGLLGRRAFRFGAADRELLKVFAAHAATALRNARAFAESEARRRSAELLAKVGQALSPGLEPDLVAQRIMESARSLLGVQSAAVYRLDPDTGDLVLAAQVRESVSTFRWVPRLARGTGAGGAAIRARAPVHTPDCLADARLTYAPEVRAEFELSACRAILAIPLAVEDQILGALNIGDRTGRVYSEPEIRLVQAFADQAALALENARLYARERAARAEAEAAARALRESEERHRGLVEASIQGIYIHRDFVIRYANPALAAIFGYDGPDELVGREVWMLIAPHERERMEAYGRARLRGETVPPRYEFQGVRKDGSLIWLETLASVTTWEGAPAVLATFVDITERRRLEEQLLQSQKMEAVGRLAGGVAHDFNNLLTVIGGRSSLLLRRLGPEDPLRRDLELIHRTVERAAQLTQQLLAFSRKQVLQPKVLDLNAVVAAMEGMLRRLIGEHIELVTQPAAGLWPVKADPNQLEQVILNLALNARDAMPAGGRLTVTTANVSIGAPGPAGSDEVAPGDYAVLTVADTGTGMEPEVLARVFEPFFTTKEVGKGTGLGLSTVYGIIKQSGGHVAAASRRGQGSVFTIYLPRAGERPADAAAPAGGGEGPQGWETILIVEDEPEVRELAREILEMGGYTVLEGTDAASAERFCREHAGPIHLLLTDVVMPQVSGRELARRLGALRPALRVLYMSGYTDDAIVHHGVLDPSTAFLPKPFTPAELCRKVREALDAG
jgi:PAS domain S-box-containing protein